MLISINGEKKESIEIFKDVNEFNKFIENNFKINILNKYKVIQDVYFSLINRDGNISYSKLKRWISEQFNFTFKETIFVFKHLSKIKI